jgi:hypothetical protein
VKLYLVTYTTEVYVAAESEQGARFVAARAVRENAEYVDCDPLEVRHDDKIAPGWEAGSLVWHDGHEDISLESLWPDKPTPPAQGEQQGLFGKESS